MNANDNKKRKDWLRLNETRKSKSDETNQFPTPKDVVEGLVKRYGHGLKGKKVHCFADDYRISWFYLLLKEKYSELGLAGLYATQWVEGGKGLRAFYDGETETVVELADDGSLFNECSKKTTAECDVVFTNPPFKKYSEMLNTIDGKDFVLMAPHILPYRMNDPDRQIIYRIVKGEAFIEPKEISIWNQKHTRQAACVVISTLKPEGVQKADINLNAKYDSAKHKMFIDVETGEKTGIVNCDRFKDFPIDWPGLVAVPVTTLWKIANQKVNVNDVYGMIPRSDADGTKDAELVDVIDVHGFYGKGDFENPYIEFCSHKIIKVKLEDGRIPFQRIIVKLNRRVKA